MLGVVPNFAAGPDRYQIDLKRAVLLFDKIVIPSIHDSRGRALTDGHDHIAADLDFLGESGLCEWAPAGDYAAARRGPEALREDESRLRPLKHAVGRDAITLSRLARGNPDFLPHLWEAQDVVYRKLAPDHRLRAEHHVARALSVAMRKKGENSNLVLDSASRLGKSRDARRKMVLAAVLRDLELPVADAPLQDVLAFREEVGGRLLLHRLHKWMRGLADSVEFEKEIRDELEDLKETHRRALRTHRLRGQASMFKFVIVSSAELVESLVKLRLTKLAETGLGMFQSADHLLERECDLGGGEVSYLVRAEERLYRSR